MKSDGEPVAGTSPTSETPTPAATVEFRAGAVDFEALPRALVTCRASSDPDGAHAHAFELTAQNPTHLWTPVAQAGWNGGYEVRVDWTDAEGRTIRGRPTRSKTELFIVSSPILERLSVPVIATGEFDAGAAGIERIVVDLRYEDRENDYRREQSLEITTPTEPLRFEVDLLDPRRREVEYRYAIHYGDGEVRPIPADGAWLPAPSGFLIVGEHYPVRVEVVGSLAFSSEPIDAVEVRLRFEDEENSIREESVAKFEGVESTPHLWRVRGYGIGVPDPASRDYTYEVTFITAGGEVIRRPPSVGSDGILIVPPLEPTSTGEDGSEGAQSTRDPEID